MIYASDNYIPKNFSGNLIEQFEKSFKKDPIIREYYTGDLDVEFEISRLTQDERN